MPSVIYQLKKSLSSVLMGFVRSVPRLSLEGEGASSPSRSRRYRGPSLKSVSGGGAAGAAMLAVALPIVAGRKRDPGTGRGAGGREDRVPGQGLRKMEPLGSRAPSEKVNFPGSRYECL